MTEFETVKVDGTEIACDGGKGALGHPKVYLAKPKDSDEISCPYCSKKFVFGR